MSLARWQVIVVAELTSCLVVALLLVEDDCHQLFAVSTITLHNSVVAMSNQVRLLSMKVRSHWRTLGGRFGLG